MQGTTIVAVRRDGRMAIAGDGQITMSQNMVMKGSAVKVRRIYDGRVVVGFAGSVADALTLSELFEGKLQQYAGNLRRAAVELARTWRGDKSLRNLEAMLIAADGRELLVISGSGEVIEPDGDCCAIGSGGAYALAAARALLAHTPLSARQIAAEAIGIAADICVYTNHHLTVEEAGEGLPDAATAAAPDAVE